jgi:hypothetical protein
MNMKGDEMSDETPKKKTLASRIHNLFANVALTVSASFAIGMIVYVLFFLK